MVLKASLFSDSLSGDTDPSDEELDDDSDDDLERESLLSSISLVRNPSLLGTFFEVISWVVLLLGIDVDLVSEVDPFLLCRERIHRRSLPRRTLPEFDIVNNVENSLLIKINLSNCRDSPFEVALLRLLSTQIELYKV